MKKTPGDIITLHKCTKNHTQKIEKNILRYHHFTHVYQKLWLEDVQFPRNGARQTDRQMGRQKKLHIEVGAPPKKGCK